MKIDYGQIQWGRDLSMDNLQRIFVTIGENWVVKLVLGMLISVNSWIFPDKNEAVSIVIALVFLDTLTGLLKAIRQNNVSSSGFFRCILKVAVYLIMLMMGGLLDKVLGMQSFFSALTTVATMLAATESLSICENIAALGFAVPEKLISMLKFAQGDKKPKSGSDETK